MNQRYVFIDYMKVVAIFLVVLGHMPITNSLLNNVIYSFHMPLFFWISGFLMKTTPNPKFYSNNAWCLLLVIVPYYLFLMLFNGATDFVFYRNDFDLDNNIIQPLKGLILGNSHTPPLWFLLSLFWMRCVYYSTAQFIKKYHSLIMLFASFAVAIAIYFTTFRCNLYNISSFVFGFPFFCLGAFCNKTDFCKILSTSNIIISCTFVMSIVLYLVIFIPTEHFTLHSLELGDDIFRYYVLGILGTIATLCVFVKIKILPNFVIIISQGTLVIYSIHQCFIQLFKIIYKLIFHITTPPPYMDSASAILFSVITILILYKPICWILNSNFKYIRLLAGKK